MGLTLPPPAREPHTQALGNCVLFPAAFFQSLWMKIPNKGNWPSPLLKRIDSGSCAFFKGETGFVENNFPDWGWGWGGMVLDDSST